MKSMEKLLIIASLFQGVWCSEFSISLPESVEGQKGLCVLIPCSFTINEENNNMFFGDLTGFWLKDGTDKNSNRVFDSKTPKENRIKGEILGDLLIRNCTTVFHNIKPKDRGVYYFRIESSAGLKYTFSTLSVSMIVQESPITTFITLYKKDQEELEVQNEVLEGTSLSLICSAQSPSCLLRPPSFSWNFLPEEKEAVQKHNTSFSSSQLNFIATHLHHGLQFTCTATYQLQKQNITAQSSHTLQVLYAPRNTSVSVSPASSVLLGSSVSLSCSSDANPAVLIYTWYRENGEQIGTGNHLIINTTDSTHSGFHYCRAQNQYGDQNSSVQLDVQYAPQLSSSSSCNSTQDLIVCSCEVVGNPPPTLEWRLSAQNISLSDSVHIQKESVGETALRSFIFIRQSVKDMPTVQCVGVNKLGVASQIFFSFLNMARCSAGGVDVSSVLIGAAVGASVMMTLCVIVLCLRKETPPPPGRGQTSALHMVDHQDKDEDEGSVYMNKAVSLESLHYSTVVFLNGAGSEIRGLDKLTADYATVSFAPQC